MRQSTIYLQSTVVRMNDGSEAEFGPGDVGSIPPGHDAWVVGDEPFISIDFGDVPDLNLGNPVRVTYH